MNPETTTEESRALVRVAQPETMNLLGLFLRGILERRLAISWPRIRGEILVEASGMMVTLRFGDREVVLTREPPSRKPRATVRGTMRALLDAALGRGRVRAWLAGRLRVRGGLLTLWRLLQLLKVT